MEDVLDVYHRPHDPRRPVVGIDEKPVQLLADVRDPLPPRPGDPAKADAEYARNGTANVFCAFEPLGNWRDLAVTDRRTAADFARQMRHLCDELYPDAEVIRVVLDNLNTHTLGSLFATFPPDEAWRLARRLEFHYTPKHASWLNVAELELSVLARQCLDRRIPDERTLAREVAAWVDDRNRVGVRINWTFRVADARRKLSHLYPQELQR